MHDTELYRHLLGLESPWSVARVEVGVKEQKVSVWAEHAENARWACPECKTELALYDHVEERSWRHLDSCQFQTLLHARIPRVECPKHGSTFDLNTGRPTTLPATLPVDVFAVKVEGEDILIELTEQTEVTG